MTPTVYLPLRKRMESAGIRPRSIMVECDWQDLNALRIAAIEWLCTFPRNCSLSYYKGWAVDDDHHYYEGPDLDTALVAALDALLPKEEV